jgi:hypothetical protein
MVMAPVRPWPDLRKEDRWLATLMEELLDESLQSPEELRSRAIELRAEAARGQAGGDTEAVLALADRYEQAAAARLGAR